MNLRQNLILIGMPGSGKSTIGRLLAQKLNWTFVDTDQLIQAKAQRPLQTILDEDGIGAFIRLESSQILELEGDCQILSTGGSVVLDQAAMQHLHKIGYIVYLNVPLSKIERRLWNIKTRGIVIKKNQSIRDIFHIRRPLYERYADRIQPTLDRTANIIADEIIEWLTIQQRSNK